MNKKRGSHVGVMISFMILIVFIAFIYSALEPAIKNEDNKDLFLNNIEKKLINSFEDEYIVNLVNPLGPMDCINISVNDESENNYIVKNKNNKELNSSLEDDILFIDLDSQDYFIIYNSKWINSSNDLVSGDCGDSYDNFELIKKSIFKNKVKNIINKYNSDYASLKQNLNISSDLDFQFDFVLENKSEINTIKDIISENVYSKEIFINYLNENAVLKLGKIKLSVWKN